MKKNILVLLILLFAVSYIQAQVRIKMKNENGVFTTPCTVNGLKLRFIFDTGASNVCISLSEALFMLKNGYLAEEDIKGSSYSQIANGDVIENTTVNFRELEIGGLKLNDIDAIIVHELSAPLLLGQSAIQKLGKIQLEDDELIIFSGVSSSSENACLEAGKLISKAKQQYFENLNTLSSDTYQKAFDLCPNSLSCMDVYFMGSAFYSTLNYLLAIKYLQKASNCATDKEMLWYIYSSIGQSYRELHDYHNALINNEMALLYATENGQKSFLKSEIGTIYFEQSNFFEAKSQYEKSAYYYLKDISFTVDDVSDGKVKDKVLGECYWNIATCCFKLKLEDSSLAYALHAALCGNESARSYIRKYYGKSDIDFDKKR
jgi:clan AA aspartic protease (TIGR02281 family)